MTGGWSMVGRRARQACRQRRRRVILLAFLLLLLALLALAAGSGRLDLAGLWDFVTAHVARGNGSPGGFSVIGHLRLPRVLMALACGAMLGLSGAALQSLTRNGLADPGLLGVREGAALMVILLMLTLPTAPTIMRPLAGMAGGLVVALIAIGLARSLAGLRFILIGIGLSWFLSALIALALAAADLDRLQAALIWMAGSLAGTTPALLPLAAGGLVIGGGLLLLTSRAADGANLGAGLATGLGVPLRLLALVRLVAPVLLTAVAVSCAGSLGFVGLIAPHLARLLLGGGEAATLAGSAVFGAGLVLLADTLGRSLFAPVQIPAGIMLAVIGVPVLLLLLWRRRHQI